VSSTAPHAAPRNAASVDQIDAALPQTQCTRCGYADCRAYAEAIAGGEAINRCPPGGAEGIVRLAAITGRAALPLDTTCGREAPRGVALIDEAWCIGCTLCLDACPVDAILGAHKRMHTVTADACNGCELCLPACPVDCISMLPVSGSATGWQAWSTAQATDSLGRYRFHQLRVTRSQQEHDDRQAAKAAAKLADLAAHSQHTDPAMLDRKRAVIEAALARARAKALPAQTDEPPP
jgi:electron transport complex protein RnfB